MPSISSLSRRHWFYIALPICLLVSLQFQRTFSWAADPAFGEAVTLFDWCIFLPALFALCYRDMPIKALAIRMLALACGGFWVAGMIVPDTSEEILREWSWLRGAGLAVVVVFEIAALVVIVRMAFGGTANAADLERQGMPPFIAKLMLAEARFWRWVWNKLHGR
jgi:hypothetical protein